jgi:hypothetical protein
MTGWNLPPGVTGNEYAIAGPDREWTEEVECENDGATFTVLGKGDDAAIDTIIALADKAGGTTNPAEIASLLRNAGLLARQVKRGLFVAEDAVCPFVGEADLASYQDEAWWDCPICGDQHTKTIDREEDPDDARDRMLDR